MTKTLTFGFFILSIVFIGSFVGQTPAQKVRAVRETAVAQSPAALVLAEEFSYPTGQLTTVSGGNWVTNTGSGNFIPVIAGSLSYSGYASSGVGNKIQLVASTASSEDAYRSFTTQTAGTTYASFLVSVTNTDLLPPNSSATGEYFAGFISSASTSAFAARVTIRQGVAANTFQLGLRASGNAANVQVFSGTDLPVGSPVLVVISYELISGDANDVTKMWINPSLSGGEPAPTLTQVSAADLADVGRFFVRQGTGAGFSTPNAEIDGLRISTAWADIGGGATAPEHRAPGDFDGNGRTDFSIVREGPGGAAGNFIWWIKLNGPNTTSVTPFGLNSDFILPADYDGDGADDIAIWRGQQGTHGFWVLNSSTGTASFHPFGQAGDDPVVVADYSGDGVDDFAIYRRDPVQGYFWMWLSSGPYSNQYSAVPWGSGDDSALFGDYNGDGFGDFTVTRVEGQRIRIWTLFGSADLLGQNFTTDVFGGLSDLFVPGDYDGDGATDLAVTRWVGNSLRWIYKPSSGGTVVQTNWGIGSGFDFEVHGDYDGDGTTDLAVWRTSGALAGYYIVRLSSGGVRYEPWGTVNDTPTIWEFK